MWVAFVGVIAAAVGIEMTFNPPATSKGKWAYRIAFVCLGLSVCGLTYLQDKQGKPVIPQLPRICIETFHGLPEGVPNNPHLRLHRLEVRNPSAVGIENFCSRLQLPEPILATMETNSPTGTEIGWRPLVNRVTISGSGNKWLVGPASSVNYLPPAPSFFPDGFQGQLFGFSREGGITGVWELTIDKLPPLGAVSILLLTSCEAQATNYIALAATKFLTNGATISTTTQGTTNSEVIIHNVTVAFIPDSNSRWQDPTIELRFSLEGTYQYQAEGKPGTQRFLVPIVFDGDQRRLSSLAIQRDEGKWQRIMIEYQ